MRINDPDVVAELRAVFQRYEAALHINDLQTLRELFWNSEFTTRFGPGEMLYGAEQIHAFRAARPDVPRPRNLFNTSLTTFGRDHAVANTEYRNANEGPIGRQSQTWVRFPAGWRIVAAHVSFFEGQVVK